MRSFLIFVFLLVIGPWPALAKPLPCLSATDVDKLVEPFPALSKFKGKEHCPQDDVYTLVLHGLKILHDVKWPAQMPASKGELYAGDDYNWWIFFIMQVRDFSFETDCIEGAGAWIEGYSGVMHLCATLSSKVVRPTDLAVRMLHEARHVDGPSHVTCQSGTWAGREGFCDNNFAEMGAYRISLEAYAQYARYAVGISPQERAYARFGALEIAKNNFVQAPKIGSLEVFLVQTTDNKFWAIYINKKDEVEVEAAGSAPFPGRLLPGEYLNNFLPDDRSQKMTVLWPNGVIENPDDQLPHGRLGSLNALYNPYVASDRKNFVDGFTSSQRNLSIINDDVFWTCKAGDKLIRGRFPGGVARGLIYPDGYDPNASDFKILLTTGGEVINVGCDANDQPYMKGTDKSDWLDPRTLSLYKFRKGRLALFTDGTLMLYGEDGTSKILKTPLKAKIKSMVPYKYYPFFDAPHDEPVLPN